jgi:hypothetical protein
MDKGVYDVRDVFEHSIISLFTQDLYRYKIQTYPSFNYRHYTKT